MNKARALPLLLSTLLLATGCDRPVEPPPLEGATIGGDFTLVGEDGRPVNSHAFDGKYRLIYFGYTFCPDICPVDMQHLMRGLAKFRDADADRGGKIVPIFITIDPARDTPAVLRQWTAAFDPDPVGLTGSEAQIAAVAKKYAILFQRQTPNAQGAYLVDHARMATLFGPKGEPIALIPQDKSADAVAAELDRWVR